MFSSQVHSKSSTPMIRGAGPTGGGGGGGALGLCLCLLRWPPRDLTPANRAPFGVSAVATTAVMSARRMLSRLMRERLYCRTVLSGSALRLMRALILQHSGAAVAVACSWSPQALRPRVLSSCSASIRQITSLGVCNHSSALLACKCSAAKSGVC